MPATSYSAGHQGFNDGADIIKNIDMDSYRNTASWPRNVQGADDWETWWWHSDIKDVAYAYTHEVFKRIVTEAE